MLIESTALINLLILVTMMAASTWLAAFAPYFLSLSSEQIYVISTYSVGLLVGAGLTIVIPEGVDAMYEAMENLEIHRDVASWVGGGLLAGFLTMYLIDSMTPHPPSPAPPMLRVPNRQPILPTSRRGSIVNLPELEALHPALESQNDTYGEGYSYDAEHEGSGSPLSARSTVIGLLAHALADGISLGASSVTAESGKSNTSLQMVIFIAIIMHKGPTAFALSSLLIASGIPNSSIRKSLYAFSLATPVGAIVTYGLLSAMPINEELGFWTGLTLVFSGGTFLFVATHSIQRSSNDPTSKTHVIKTVALVLCGMITPPILAKLVGHGGHEH